jgi:HK97 family phage major capsid protein
MTRLETIETRLAEIEKELSSDAIEAMTEENLDSLEKEVRSLQEERKTILDAAEKRRSLEKAIAEGRTGVDITDKIMNGGKKEMEERVLDINSAEYRSAFLKKIRGLDLNEVEQRAFTSASDSAGAVIPTQTANEVIKKLKQLAPLLGEITLLHVAGNVTFAVEGTKADADIHSENASIAGTEDKLVPVTLGSYEICKLVQVSKTVATMSIDAFEAWLVDMIAEKIAEKIGAYLISGTGASQPTGVEKAQTWDASNSVTVASTAATTAANVQKLISLLPGSYDRNAKFLMSKKTLFAEFMPLQDNTKNKIVSVEGKEYFVYGYPVMLDENVALGEAYLGDFKKIVANLSEAINVVSGFDINTNSYKYLGSAMFDSKVAVGEAFVKLAKEQ